MVKNTKCEMKRLDGAWAVVTIDEAVRRRGDNMRCRECKGRVHAHAKTSKMAAHFAHAEAWPHCSLGSEWNGKTDYRMHPQQLI